MKTILLHTLLFLSALNYAQNIGINGNGNNAHPSALLDIDAVATPSLGILIPRIALQATNLAAPVSAPATSLLVYNTATASSGTTAVVPGYYYWDGAKWASFNTSNTNSTSSSGGGCMPTMISALSPSLSTGSGALIAEQYCANLIESGFTDWRLPSYQELTYAFFNFTYIKSPGARLWTTSMASLTDVTSGGSAAYFSAIANAYFVETNTSLPGIGEYFRDTGVYLMTYPYFNCRCVR